MKVVYLMLSLLPTAAVLKILGSHLWRTYVLGEPIEEIAAENEAEDAGGGVVEDVVDIHPGKTAERAPS